MVAILLDVGVRVAVAAGVARTEQFRELKSRRAMVAPLVVADVITISRLESHSDFLHVNRVDLKMSRNKLLHIAAGMHCPEISPVVELIMIV